MIRIVIVGAGWAGVNAMQALAGSLKPSDNVEVVLFEKSKYFYHTFGASRAYTEESYIKNMFIPFDKTVPAAAASFVSFKRAVVTTISTSPNQVTFRAVGDDDLASPASETITFDYLILATGSTYTVPIKQDSDDYSRAMTEAKLKEVREQIARANKILVVGGGAVGCEVAGDIASHYPTKQVTILEGHEQLLAVDRLTDSFRTKLADALKALNVNVVLGERLPERLTGNSFQKRTLITDKGTVIESDIQLLCAGFSPSGELVRAMDAAMIDAGGAIRVNDKLQLDGDKYTHVFALGDATNHATPKMGYYAGEQAKHLAAELIAVVRKKQAAVTKPFPPIAVQTLVLALGPQGGVTQLPLFGGWVLGDWITRLYMSGDMMAARFWAALGATLPPQ